MSPLKLVGTSFLPSNRISTRAFLSDEPAWTTQCSRVEHRVRSTGGSSRLAMSLAIFVAIATSGCGRAPASDRWREEVQLSDGRVIVVKRGASFRDRTPLGDAPLVTVVGTTIQFDVPNVTSPKWSTDLIATTLDVDRATGRFVIVATTLWCEAWHRNGRPAGWRWAFELRDGRWVPVPVPASVPFGSSNLLPVAHDRYGGAQSSFVSLAEKRALISSVDYVSPIDTDEQLRTRYLASQSQLCIERQPLQGARQ